MRGRPQDAPRKDSVRQRGGLDSTQLNQSYRHSADCTVHSAPIKSIVSRQQQHTVKAQQKVATNKQCVQYTTIPDVEVSHIKYHKYVYIYLCWPHQAAQVLPRDRTQKKHTAEQASRRPEPQLNPHNSLKRLGLRVQCWASIQALLQSKGPASEP